MRKGKLALAALLAALVAAAVLLAVGATAGSAKSESATPLTRWRGSTSARTTTAAGRRRTTTAACTCRRCSAARCRRRTRRTSRSARSSSQTVASLVNQGYKMIFGTSYGFFDKKLAAKYPSVLFEQATGTDTAKNLSEYFGAAEDTVYLSGMAAGAATKNEHDRLRRRVPDPRGDPARERVRARRAATHPGAKVKLVWTNSWFDPAKEKKAAREPRTPPGADVLGQNVDSPATGQFAESEGIPWVGYDSDAQKFAPKSWLTAAVYNWGPYYLRRVQGRDGRHVEARLLLRQHQGRLHGARAVRARACPRRRRPRSRRR